jgi:GT2 family glycosyltransferase
MTATPSPLSRVGVVVIGRNEAHHLADCIRSIPGDVAGVVYVDSASVDGSAAVAAGCGAEVVELNPQGPISAAGARNAGFERLLQRHSDLALVQFVDGDCVLDPGWLPEAVKAIDADHSLGAVWGMLRERYPEASIYNRVSELEWRVPPAGETSYFGGLVLIRVEAFRAAGGFDPGVVASEDQELSARVRAKCWRIQRIATLTGVHDSRIMRFGQWWRRGVRRGVGYGQTWSRHGGRSDRAAIAKIVGWAGVLPCSAIAAAWPTRGLSLAVLLLYPLRALRTAIRFARREGSYRDGLVWGAYCVLAPFPALLGLIQFCLRRGRGWGVQIIEYRGPEPTPTPPPTGRTSP